MLYVDPVLWKIERPDPYVPIFTASNAETCWDGNRADTVFVTFMEVDQFTREEIYDVDITLFGTYKDSFDWALLILGWNFFVRKLKIEDCKYGISCVMIQNHWRVWEEVVSFLGFVEGIFKNLVLFFEVPESYILSSTGNQLV